MKVRVDMECTPEEARAFLGLPDVTALQAQAMDRLREKLSGSIEAMTPDALLKLWLPAGFQGLEEMQKRFWSQMQGGRDPA